MNMHAHSKKTYWLIGVIVLAALVLAACQPAATPAAPAPTDTTAPMATATTAPAATATTAAAAVTEPTVSIATDPKLGKILVDQKGMTLYAYTKDAADKSNCAGGCLKAWPALLSAGSPKAGDGVDASMLGTTAMADGSKIVTYNHMPLYYYMSDAKPGDATGQTKGNVWFVVGADGKMVGVSGSVPATGSTPAATTAASSSSTALNVATDTKLGKILVDGKGMTLYMFTKDVADKSNCSAGCLKAWPPFLANGTPTAGAGVDSSMIGSATLADGSKIVTYNHMPLYYWMNDAKPGDTTGQGNNKVWWVVAPDGKPVGMDSSSSAAPASSASGTVINVATDAKLGKILVDGKGMTLYMFTKDEPNKSNCAANCLKAWPAFLAQGTPTAGAGVDASLIGTATLADGSKIVTYNKMPLYYWFNDKNPGDATGQANNNVWWVVAPDGKPVGMSAPASSGSSY